VFKVPLSFDHHTELFAHVIYWMGV